MFQPKLHAVGYCKTHQFRKYPADSGSDRPAGVRGTVKSQGPVIRIGNVFSFFIKTTSFQKIFLVQAKRVITISKKYFLTHNPAPQNSIADFWQSLKNCLH